MSESKNSRGQKCKITIIALRVIFPFSSYIIQQANTLQTSHQPLSHLFSQQRSVKNSILLEVYFAPMQIRFIIPFPSYITEKPNMLPKSPQPLSHGFFKVEML